MLAQQCYYDVPPEHLANALVGPFSPGLGSASPENLIVFDARTVGAPNYASGRWVFDLVRSLGKEDPERALKSSVIPKVFRFDLYDRAMALAGLVPTTTKPLISARRAA
jgi:hypothetical protein